MGLLCGQLASGNEPAVYATAQRKLALNALDLLRERDLGLAHDGGGSEDTTRTRVARESTDCTMSLCSESRSARASCISACNWSMRCMARSTARTWLTLLERSSRLCSAMISS